MTVKKKLPDSLDVTLAFLNGLLFNDGITLKYPQKWT